MTSRQDVVRILRSGHRLYLTALPFLLYFAIGVAAPRYFGVMAIFGWLVGLIYSLMVMKSYQATQSLSGAIRTLAMVPLILLGKQMVVGSDWAFYIIELSIVEIGALMFTLIIVMAAGMDRDNFGMVILGFLLIVGFSVAVLWALGAIYLEEEGGILSLGMVFLIWAFVSAFGKYLPYLAYEADIDRWVDWYTDRFGEPKWMKSTESVELWPAEINDDNPAPILLYMLFWLVIGPILFAMFH
ncbi:hypothetical protein [Pontibacter sp. G13]|uniref:hypothetical protein n=1 Tax=Pontibacter sp. G13 TaxID=3074898 RepID=UPI002889993D|nr:hypothetical protein [Pontibacter sp. G13]WNJ18720.1 hypothetical protein RJD25_28015 [Pontibacter sp. G13]